jgi:hypothetical protein
MINCWLDKADEMLCCRLQLSVEAQVVASLATADSSLSLAFAVECSVLAVLLNPGV